VISIEEKLKMLSLKNYQSVLKQYTQDIHIKTFTFKTKKKNTLICSTFGLKWKEDKTYFRNES